MIIRVGSWLKARFLHMNSDKTHNLIIPRLIIGLGNPEPKYDRTRHNIGFEAVDSLARDWGLSWQENKRFQGFIAEGDGDSPGQNSSFETPNLYESLRAIGASDAGLV